LLKADSQARVAGWDARHEQLREAWLLETDISGTPGCSRRTARPGWPTGMLDMSN